MFKIFKISCDEATTICDKAQYGEASLMERFKLNWHIITCKICKLYAKQNALLTTIYKDHAKGCIIKRSVLSEEDKLALKRQLENIE